MRIKGAAASAAVLVCVVAAFSLGNSSPAGGDQRTADDPGSVYWGYEGDIGPRFWGRLSPGCSGRSQSPIDIRKTDTTDLPSINFNYHPTPVVMINNGHSVQLNYADGSSIEVDGQRFALEEFHFHSPSEHTVQGRRFPLEMHLVHHASGGATAVVGVLIDTGRHNRALDSMWQKLPAVACLVRSLKDRTINAGDLLPASRSYYRYDGSLTTPPCKEGVSWFVLKNTIRISPQQLNAFRQLYSNNNRPVQPLNGREVKSDRSN